MTLHSTATEAHSTAIETSSVTSTSSSSSSSSSDVEVMSEEKRYLLGDEAPAFDESTELEGVRAILEALTEEERADMTDEHMPIRYFRRKRGDVKVCVECIRATIQWRREFGVETIRQAFSPTAPDPELARHIRHENANGFNYVRGYTKEGRAVLCIHTMSARCKPFHELHCLQASLFNYEKAIDCSIRKSNQLSNGTQQMESCVFLIDFTGFSWSRAPPRSAITNLLKIGQAFYINRMTQCFLIQPPRLFSTAWKMFRPFLRPAVRKRIVFIDKSNIESQLWSLFDDKDANLETWAGGKLERSDFDLDAYYKLPFNVAWGEHEQQQGKLLA